MIVYTATSIENIIDNESLPITSLKLQKRCEMKFQEMKGTRKAPDDLGLPECKPRQRGIPRKGSNGRLNVLGGRTHPTPDGYLSDAKDNCGPTALGTEVGKGAGWQFQIEHHNRFDQWLQWSL